MERTYQSSSPLPQNRCPLCNGIGIGWYRHNLSNTHPGRMVSSMNARPHELEGALTITWLCWPVGRWFGGGSVWPMRRASGGARARIITATAFSCQAKINNVYYAVPHTHAHTISPCSRWRTQFVYCMLWWMFWRFGWGLSTASDCWVLSDKLNCAARIFLGMCWGRTLVSTVVMPWGGRVV